MVLDGAESRKQADIKTEDGKKERHLLYYDGESVSGKVSFCQFSYNVLVHFFILCVRKILTRQWTAVKRKNQSKATRLCKGINDTLHSFDNNYEQI